MGKRMSNSSLLLLSITLHIKVARNGKSSKIFSFFQAVVILLFNGTFLFPVFFFISFKNVRGLFPLSHLMILSSEFDSKIIQCCDCVM